MQIKHRDRSQKMVKQIQVIKYFLIDNWSNILFILVKSKTRNYFNYFFSFLLCSSAIEFYVYFRLYLSILHNYLTINDFKIQ